MAATRRLGLVPRPPTPALVAAVTRCRYCDRRAPMHRRLALRAWLFVASHVPFGSPVGRIEHSLRRWSEDVCSVYMGRNR